MKRNPLVVVLTGVGLLVIGAALTYWSSRGFAEQRAVVNAGSCKMEMTVVQLAGLPENSQSGSLVLFHGLSANKVIMTYLARAFALQGLRVYVPDLPGHGGTAGPFTPDQAEACAQSFVRGLMARGYLRPDRTLLAGHSMGGAIALRVAAKIRVAGVIAISPAPMRSAHGVSPEVLLYQNPPPVPPNTLIITGQFEPQGLRLNAADYAASSMNGTTKFVEFPFNSHVSVLFSPGVAKMSQQWAAQTLHLPAAERQPLRGDLLGGLLGLTGILLLAGPFLRESVGETPRDEIAETKKSKTGQDAGGPQSVSLSLEPVEEAAPSKSIATWRVLMEIAVASIAVVGLLHYGVPLRMLHLFEGDYLASFFLIVGMLLLSLHGKEAARQFSTRWGLLAGAGFAALVLHLLITGWLQLTITGSWLPLDRWKRFPLFFIAAFAFSYALEVVLGRVAPGGERKRFLLNLGLLAMVWMVLSFGVVKLHSGAILLMLLAPYFLLLFVLLRLGAQLVRRQSGSALAAAVFGAILLTGFCLVLFPVS